MDSKDQIARLLLQEARRAVRKALALLRAEVQRKETRLSWVVICASLVVLAFGAVLPFLWRESRTLAYGISLAKEWRWAASTVAACSCWLDWRDMPSVVGSAA